MTKSPKISNDALIAAGLELMKQAGKPITKVKSKGRSMIYSDQNGKTVRLRTCNDHTLITGADEPSSDAKLTIEGTDFLLAVMPEIERTPGKVKGYLIPTKIAVEAVRTSHQAWLDSKPNTHGGNRTPCLWFRKNGKTKMSSDYETKWAKYRLSGEAYTNAADVVAVGDAAAANAVGASDGSVKAEVEMARQRISRAAGVSPDAVKITIQFGL